MPHCPLCQQKNSYLLPKSKTITSDYDYHRCLPCGLIFQQHSDATINKTIDYNEKYFFSEYQQQYGLSYEEDKQNLMQLSLRRLQHLITLSQKDPVHGQIDITHAKLLDIGCALGYFLASAEKLGFQSLQGIETSAFACDYIARESGYPVTNIDAQHWQTKEKKDIISMFFVLEHIQQQNSILDKISKSINAGGWLLLALPSTWGPLFLWQYAHWLETHPIDHYVDYDPLSILRALKRYGFRVKDIVNTTPKINRLPRWLRLMLNQSQKASWAKASWDYGVNLLKFGDTMEIYAQIE